MRPNILSDSFRAAIAEALGRGDVVLRAVPGGASNLAFEVLDAAAPTAAIAFLRCKTDVSMDGLGYSLRREAAVMQQAERLGLPVPRVLGVFDDPDSVLMEVAKGTSSPNAEEIEAVAAEYMGLVARLHSLDVTSFPIEQHPSMEAAIADDLNGWIGRAEQNGVLDGPLLALAARVLTGRMPTGGQAPVVVHGDIGPGNFMAAAGGVTAMLDWELAHVGDLHEDLAWLWMRGAHSHFGDPQQRIAEYQRASGVAVEHSRLEWHLAFVMFKSVVAMHSRLRTPAASELSYVQAIVRLTYDALLAARLSLLLGRPVALLDQTPKRAVTLETILAEEVLTSGGLARIPALVVEYLRDSAAQAEWERDELEADLAALGTGHDHFTQHLRSCPTEDLAAAAAVVARHADRRACAMPKAQRRIAQAGEIGLW
jgi:aminoglycoside phosphotransferase (APT) family kinase protein